MRRLLALDQRGELTARHVQASAEGLGVSQRTVWRWLKRARADGQLAPGAPARLVIDEDLRRRLAYWRGNAAAVHRDLISAAERGEGPEPPSLATLERAIRRDLSAGERAGLRRGERARRAFDVFLQRPAGYRNQAWEADHVEAPVQVVVAGRLLKPWVTWFVDAASNAVCGTAVTPGVPSREAVLAALRASIMTEPPYGPVGGLPETVRIDRGKDFLSTTVRSALGALAVSVDALPGYTPHLKGSVETLNGAAEEMLFAALPRYTHAQTLRNGRPADPDQPALPFEAFVAELLAWTRWWNTEHQIPALGARTPQQAWLADPTPIETVPARDLWHFTLEDDGRARKILTKGISWHGRFYVAAWMTGHVGTTVRVRHMPHHQHEVEVFDARTGTHLGPAVLADQAGPEQIADVLRTRATRTRQLRADLRAAEHTRRERYAAATDPQPARRIDALTNGEAMTEASDADDAHLSRLADPRLIPHAPPPDGWVLPATRQAP